MNFETPPQYIRHYPLSPAQQERDIERTQDILQATEDLRAFFWAAAEAVFYIAIGIGGVLAFQFIAA